MKPLTPDRYRIQFTVDRETHDKLRHAQDLLRHTIPDGDPAAVFDKALTLLLKELSKAKHAAVGATASGPPAGAPGAKSRHIPASVRRGVWRRDGEQCAFVGDRGRCTEKGFLEFHHLVPYAAGGQATIENLALRCRAHNAYEAEHTTAVAGPRFSPTNAGRSKWIWQLGPDRVPGDDPACYLPCNARQKRSRDVSVLSVFPPCPPW